jgi:GT2 family glycosyltransferase
MNQGIELAKGQYVVLLNQDACLREDFVQTAVDRMKSAPSNVGSLAANVFKLEKGAKTDHQLGRGILLRKRFQVTVDPDSINEHYTFSPTWCCPFLTKAMLADVKDHSKHCFDDGYFAFGEDVDLALRAQLRGWRCLYVPGLVAWHVQSGSFGGKVRIWEKPSVFRTYSLRNRYSTIIKDLPIGLLVRIAPFLVLAELLAWPYFLIRSPSTIPCLIRAYAETIRHLPETLHARHEVQRSRRVSAAYLWQFFRGL